ncbi:hypothetical protein ACEN2Y_00575 (plasmid) [Ralstonia solanacearum]|uniref:hypothetical protein n=1 Tax=Ralstonia solanacearum TaxID=305 RepID=UPI00321673B7
MDRTDIELLIWPSPQIIVANQQRTTKKAHAAGRQLTTCLHQRAPLICSLFVQICSYFVLRHKRSNTTSRETLINPPHGSAAKPLIEQAMGLDQFAAAVYVFRNRRADRISSHRMPRGCSPWVC